MYSPQVIKARLEAAHLSLREQFPKLELTYHSIEEVEAANSYFDDLLKRDPTFKLSPEEQLWIINERVVCKSDYRYWATRYGWIKGVGQRVMRYEPNIAQNIFHDILAELEESGYELILQFLKARRLGVSTECQLLGCHRIIFTPHTSAIIGSANPEDSDKLSKMLFFSLERQPHWLRPKSSYLGDKGEGVGRHKTGLFYEFSNHNRIDIEHGTQFADIGRGEDPTFFHLSECAKYENPESLIDAGLMRAVIPSTKVLGILEGTADGDTGWWPEKYWFNKRNYGKVGGGARMRPTFLPWFTGFDIYPTETWLRTNRWGEVSETWQPASQTLKEAEKAGDFVAASPLLQKHLGQDWRMPREQMYYYESSIHEYRETGTLYKWRQEMASDDVSCFQSREISIFDADLLLNFSNSVSNPLAVFGLRSQCIPEKFWPRRSEINHELPIIRVRAQWTTSLPAFDFEFVPLKFKGYSDIDPTGKLFIWEMPEDGSTYVFSADTSDGLGARQSDNSVVEVLRKGDRRRNDAQVAEFASPDVSGTELWPWALAIGTFFSVVRDKKRRQPKFVPETNREGGRNLLRFMQDRGWREVYSETRRSATRRGSVNPVYGLNLNEVNRPNILQWLYSGLTNDHLEINSPWFVGEMGTFIKDDSGKWVAAKGKKDDRILAGAEAFYVMYEHDTRNTSPEPFIDRTVAVTEEEKYPIYEDSQANPFATESFLLR